MNMQISPHVGSY